MSAPFSVYGSNPDSVAQQQLAYDSLFNNANQMTRAAYNEAAARSYQAMLQQRAIDAAAQRQDYVDSQGAQDTQDQRDFIARQNELNRQSKLADVLANKAGNDDVRQENILKEAANNAAWLPSDPVALAKYYPMLSPDRIQRLSIIVGGVGKQIATDQTVKDAPQVQAATEGQNLADAGNRYARILGDQEAIAKSPTTEATWGRFFNPFKLDAGIPSGNIARPSDYSTSRLAILAKALQPQLDAAGGKNSLINVDPTGKFVPAVEMPASATNRFPMVVTSPAPVVAPARVVNPVTPPVATNAPPVVKPIPTVTSKAQYELLASGDQYYDSNGKLRRKK